MSYRNGQRLPLEGGGALRLSVNPRARRLSIRIDARAGEAVAVAPSERRLGEVVAFARTKAGREASGDSRLSVEERYESREAYRAKADAVSKTLVAERLVLPEDEQEPVELALDVRVGGDCVVGHQFPFRLREGLGEGLSVEEVRPSRGPSRKREGSLLTPPSSPRTAARSAGRASRAVPCDG